MIVGVQETEEHDESEIVLPESYNSNHIQKKNKIDIYDPSTWPINSENACIAREESVRDGFRRLYARGSSENLTHANPFRPVLATETENADSGIGAAVQELGGLLGREEHSRTGTDNDDISDVSSLTAEAEWMRLPQ